MTADLQIGSVGPEVGNWQRFLNAIGHSDASGDFLAPDEMFGRKTEAVTREFQESAGIPITGRLDAESRRVGVILGFIPFIPSRYASILWPNVSRRPNLIVIHTAECSEASADAAENVARWFASSSSTKASAHFCVDRDSVVQCVRTTDVAWHGNQTNIHSIGIEHAGYAAQSEVEWDDQASHEIVWRSAKLAAMLSRMYGIPLRRLTLEEVKASAAGEASGFCGHVDITRAYANASGHIDPGDHFPWTSYLDRVKDYAFGSYPLPRLTA